MAVSDHQGQASKEDNLAPPEEAKKSDSSHASSDMSVHSNFSQSDKPKQGRMRSNSSDKLHEEEVSESQSDSIKKSHSVPAFTQGKSEDVPDDLSEESAKGSLSDSDDEGKKPKEESKQEKYDREENKDEPPPPQPPKKSARQMEEIKYRQPSESKLVSSKDDVGRFKMWVYRPRLIDGKNKRRIRLQSVNSLRKRKHSMEVEALQNKN